MPPALAGVDFSVEAVVVVAGLAAAQAQDDGVGQEDTSLIDFVA
jgi:hypothetical protein